MARGLRNWSYKDVTSFLKYHGYHLDRFKPGSHEYWVSEDKKSIVDVNFLRRRESYPVLTLESMIQDSNVEIDFELAKKHWRKWANNRDGCCKGKKK